MSGVNTATLIGHLGKDPESHYLQSGQCKAQFSLATSEKWTDKNSGEAKEQTQWHNVVVWGKQGENACTYLKKGSQVCVIGKITYRKYTTKEGDERWITEINAQQVVYLSKAEGGGKRDGQPREEHKAPDDDDIPF